MGATTYLADFKDLRQKSNPVNFIDDISTVSFSSIDTAVRSSVLEDSVSSTVMCSFGLRQLDIITGVSQFMAIPATNNSRINKR